jgi:hypothetical protein
VVVINWQLGTVIINTGYARLYPPHKERHIVAKIPSVANGSQVN